jgi:putative peptidoglycan lipid II flippase
MAVGTMFSRLLGLVREQLMAWYFGASGLTDAFLVAYRIPNLLRDLFAEGAFSSAFVPSFVELEKKDKNLARELLWSLFILLTGITGSICLLIFLFAPELIAIFAPSFVNDPEKLALTITLTRIMSPFLWCVSVAALFMGVLNSLKVFFIPSLAPASYNVMSILSMITLTGFLANNSIEPIISLGWGALLGGAMQAIVQIPSIMKKNYFWIRPKQIWNEHSKKVLAKLGPGLIGFAATQINLLVTTILATSSAVGATSWLNYSFRLFQLPVGVLSVSIGNSNLVHFSNAWKDHKPEVAKNFLTSSLFLSFFTIMPALVILFCLDQEIVGLIFERGKFTHDSTIQTGLALQMYALGLPFYGIYKILVPSFYTIDKQKIPVISSIVTILINILFCTIATKYYGFGMLALGTTISIGLNALILIYFISKLIDIKKSAFFNLRYLRVLLASIVSASLLEWTSGFVNFFDLNFFSKCLSLSFLVGEACLVYGLVLIILGEREAVSSIMGKIRRRFDK